MTEPERHRVAVDVPGSELGDYQRAVRTVLRHPLISERHPNATALPLVRRWADQLRIDLSAAFGHRLELTGTSARLVRVHDDLDGRRPARTRNDRVFDRRRYAHLALVLATLGRSGLQIALSELADAVAADADRIPALGLDPGSGAHRAAFVDVVTWLEDRGALHLADGSAAAWAADPARSEALYDIDRDVLMAVYRPSRTLHHVTSIAELLGRRSAAGRDSARRDAGQRARRMLVELPVVLYAEVDETVRNALRAPAAAADVVRLTGLDVERRAEGLALIDTGGLAERRFPAGGTVDQAALLLVGALADRIVDPDAPALPRLPAPARADVRAALVYAVDGGRPDVDVLTELAETAPDASDEPEPATYPLVGDGWLDATVTELVARYGKTFGAHWRADPSRLRDAALDLLAAHRLVERVPGGVLVLPLTGRYRNVQVAMRTRRAEPGLFDVGEFS
jgi:uncharacterized protein (TIGR02678 family)